MIFTTVKKRVEKEELFPNDAVMTLVDNKFSFNKKAMELFGFPLNTANTSKIANGYDDNNNILLTNMDTKDMYTNNVTAKNDFSSQLLANRLAKQFGLYGTPARDHFQLNLVGEDGGYKFVGVNLINQVNVPMQYTNEPAVDLSNNLYEYPFIDLTSEQVAAIDNFINDEIAQQEGVIQESPSVYAELIPEVQENFIVVDTKEEHVGSEQVIPAEIIKKVINTNSW